MSSHIVHHPEGFNNMIKGLQRDHHTLLDLLLSHLQLIHSNTINLFDSFIEIFTADRNPLLLECIFIKDKLSSINVIEKYLTAYHTDDSSVLIPKDVELQMIPILKLSCKVLYKIQIDYSKRCEYGLLDNTTSSHNLITSTNHQDLEIILINFQNLIMNYNHLLTNSKFKTSFKSSPIYNSTTDVMIVGYDNYDEEYETLINELYDFKQILNDWIEIIRKTSPSFVEFVDSFKHGDVFNMESFDEYSLKRKKSVECE